MPVAAQKLSLSSTSGHPGDSVSVTLSMETSEQKPSILKWEIIFPAQLLEIDGGGAEIASVTRNLGKSLTCTLRQTYNYVCILAGGQRSLADGLLATFHFKIRVGARRGTSIVRIEHIEAVSSDVKSINLLGREGQVEIR